MGNFLPAVHLRWHEPRAEGRAASHWAPASAGARIRILALVLSAALLPTAAGAQALSCTVPAKLPRPALSSPSHAETVRTPIGAYTLALTWSPQYCRQRPDEVTFQCGGSQRFGFTLHGLWPDGRGREWPQYCRRASPLPEGVIRRNLCMTPSVDLLQHEWARHGTCMATDPARYFDTARGLFEGLRFPDMTALSRRRDLTVGEFRRAFAAANRHIPGLTERSVRIRLTRAQWLDEVWLCLDTKSVYAPCSASQAPGHRLGYTMRIWRGD